MWENGKSNLRKELEWLKIAKINYHALPDDMRNTIHKPAHIIKPEHEQSSGLR